MLQDIKSVYTDSWRAAWLLPLLFLIPAAVEFAQHVVEMQAGMYKGMAAAKRASDDPLRLWFGYAKTLAISFPQYWFVRLMAFGDPHKAARVEQPAFILWLVLFALTAAQIANALFGWSAASLFGLTGRAARLVDPALSLGWSVLGIYLTAWVIAWPLGNRAIGPIRSFGIMAGSFWRTIGYLLAGILPLMAVHYGLGFLAIALTPDWLDWPILAVDALVVALLACGMAGSPYVAARHAAAKKGIALTAQ